MRIFACLFLCLLAAGCIGTDLVDTPLAPAPAQAVIEENSLSLISGESYTLSYRILATDGSEISGEWIFSSRNAGIATVEAGGLVSAVDVGQTWIDGFVSAGVADSVLVTVIADPDAVAAVIIEGDTSNLSTGESRQLSVRVENTNGAELSGIPVEWSSSDPAVAAVDANGLVEALSDGRTNITVTAEGVSSLPFPIRVGQMSAQRSGSFRGLNGYSAEGSAVLRQEDDAAELVFESNFRTQNGPGLYIYLSPEEEGVSGGVNLGELKSTSGAQTYAIPASVDPADFDYVIIYCQPFGVPFGTATLE